MPLAARGVHYHSQAARFTAGQTMKCHTENKTWKAPSRFPDNGQIRCPHCNQLLFSAINIPPDRWEEQFHKGCQIPPIVWNKGD